MRKSKSGAAISDFSFQGSAPLLRMLEPPPHRDMAEAVMIRKCKWKLSSSESLLAVVPSELTHEPAQREGVSREWIFRLFRQVEAA